MSQLPAPEQVALFDQLMGEVDRAVRGAAVYLSSGKHPAEVVRVIYVGMKEGARGEAGAINGLALMLSACLVQLAQESSGQEKR